MNNLTKISAGVVVAGAIAAAVAQTQIAPIPTPGALNHLNHNSMVTWGSNKGK